MLILSILMSATAIAKITSLVWQARSKNALNLPGRTHAIQEALKGDSPMEKSIAWMGFRTFIVSKRVQESENVISLHLVPQDGKALPMFEPGQYIMLRLHIPGHKKSVKRCYSLSASPSSEFYRITLKVLPDGLATTFIQEQIHVGATLDVSAPSGKFVASTSTEKPLVLIAGGIGITPFLSMADRIKNEPDRKAVLVYSMKNGREHVARQELRKLERLCPNLKVLTIYTAPDRTDSLGVDYDGSERISIASVSRWVDPAGSEFMICGSLAMTQSLSEQLKEFNVPDEMIHIEGFGNRQRPPSSQPELDSVNNPPETASATSTGGKTVTFQRSKKTVLWNSQADSLLDLAERNSVELESVCRSGDCGACRVGILKGCVRYDDEMRSESLDNSCLPCIAKPVGDLVLNA
ncbi:FAD-binding oxidoreductase [Thalassoglobus sp. JC818]|uniref:FAD-binding oxidoreductase n=1 Tax=Thalassoglobus sp. JC818 TaxID=3232136 RepID=UPI0034581997